MKQGKVVIALICLNICVMSSQQAIAEPALNLSITGSFESSTSTISVQVNRENSEFGLGGLIYNLHFSESLLLSREYSDYGWLASDGIFDGSSPKDTTSGSSSLGSFSDISFETACNPAGSEFAAGTGIVESLNIQLSDLDTRDITFSFGSIQASDGLGNNLVTGLGGSITSTPFTIQVPEPMSIALLGLGGLAILRKYRR